MADSRHKNYMNYKLVGTFYELSKFVLKWKLTVTDLLKLKPKKMANENMRFL